MAGSQRQLGRTWCPRGREESGRTPVTGWMVESSTDIRDSGELASFRGGCRAGFEIAGPVEHRSGGGRVGESATKWLLA